MNKLIILLIFQIYLSNSIYILYLRKCNILEPYMLSYLRYQYDSKHYPQFCNYNDKFDVNKIKHMEINLEMDWYICDYDYINENLTKYEKHYKYLESIWYDFGTCSNMDQYHYFNKTFELFYWYKERFYDCSLGNFHCQQLFNNNFTIFLP